MSKKKFLLALACFLPSHVSKILVPLSQTSAKPPNIYHLLCYCIGWKMMPLALGINGTRIFCSIFCPSLKDGTSVIFVAEALCLLDAQQGLLGVQICFHWAARSISARERYWREMSVAVDRKGRCCAVLTGLESHRACDIWRSSLLHSWCPFTLLPWQYFTRSRSDGNKQQNPQYIVYFLFGGNGAWKKRELHSQTLN